MDKSSARPNFSKCNNLVSKEDSKQSYAILQDKIIELEHDLAQLRKNVKNKESLIKLQSDQLKKMEQMQKRSLDENKSLINAKRKAQNDLDNLRTIVKEFETNKRNARSTSCGTEDDWRDKSESVDTNLIESLLKQHQVTLAAIFALCVYSAHTQEKNNIDLIKQEILALKESIKTSHENKPKESGDSLELSGWEESGHSSKSYVSGESNSDDKEEEIANSNEFTGDSKASASQDLSIQAEDLIENYKSDSKYKTKQISQGAVSQHYKDTKSSKIKLSCENCIEDISGITSRCKQCSKIITGHETYPIYYDKIMKVDSEDDQVIQDVDRVTPMEPSVSKKYQNPTIKSSTDGRSTRDFVDIAYNDAKNSVQDRKTSFQNPFENVMCNPENGPKSKTKQSSQCINQTTSTGDCGRETNVINSPQDSIYNSKIEIKSKVNQSPQNVLHHFDGTQERDTDFVEKNVIKESSQNIIQTFRNKDSSSVISHNSEDNKKINTKMQCFDIKHQYESNFYYQKSSPDVDRNISNRDLSVVKNNFSEGGTSNFVDTKMCNIDSNDTINIDSRFDQKSNVNNSCRDFEFTRHPYSKDERESKKRRSKTHIQEMSKKYDGSRNFDSDDDRCNNKTIKTFQQNLNKKSRKNNLDETKNTVTRCNLDFESVSQLEEENSTLKQNTDELRQNFQISDDKLDSTQTQYSKFDTEADFRRIENERLQKELLELKGQLSRLIENLETEMSGAKKYYLPEEDEDDEYSTSKHRYQALALYDINTDMKPLSEYLTDSIYQKQKSKLGPRNAEISKLLESNSKIMLQLETMKSNEKMSNLIKETCVKEIKDVMKVVESGDAPEVEAEYLPLQIKQICDQIKSSYRKLEKTNENLRREIETLKHKLNCTNMENYAENIEIQFEPVNSKKVDSEMQHYSFKINVPFENEEEIDTRHICNNEKEDSVENKPLHSKERDDTIITKHSENQKSQKKEYHINTRENFDKHGFTILEGDHTDKNNFEDQKLLLKCDIETLNRLKCIFTSYDKLRLENAELNQKIKELTIKGGFIEEKDLKENYEHNLHISGSSHSQNKITYVIMKEDLKNEGGSSNTETNCLKKEHLIIPSSDPQNEKITYKELLLQNTKLREEVKELNRSKFILNSLSYEIYKLSYSLTTDTLDQPQEDSDLIFNFSKIKSILKNQADYIGKQNQNFNEELMLIKEICFKCFTDIINSMHFEVDIISETDDLKDWLIDSYLRLKKAIINSKKQDVEHCRKLEAQIQVYNNSGNSVVTFRNKKKSECIENIRDEIKYCKIKNENTLKVIAGVLDKGIISKNNGSEEMVNYRKQNEGQSVILEELEQYKCTSSKYDLTIQENEIYNNISGTEINIYRKNAKPQGVQYLFETCKIADLEDQQKTTENLQMQLLQDSKRGFKNKHNTQELSTDIEELQYKLESQQKLNDELQFRLYEAFIEINQYKKDTFKLKNEQETIRDLREQLTKASTKIKEYKSKIDRNEDLQMKLEHQMKITDDLRMQLLQASDKVRNKSLDFESSKVECEALRDNIQRLKDNILLATSLRNKYSELLEKYNRQNCELVKQNIFMKENIGIIEEYKLNLADNNKTINSLQNEIHILKMDQGEVNRLRLELSKLKENYVNIRREKEELQKVSEEYKNLQQDLSPQDIQRIIDECEKYKANLNCLNARISKYIQDQSEYEKEAEVQKQKLLEENAKLRSQLSDGILQLPNTPSITDDVSTTNAFIKCRKRQIESLTRDHSRSEEAQSLLVRLNRNFKQVSFGKVELIEDDIYEQNSETRASVPTNTAIVFNTMPWEDNA